MNDRKWFVLGTANILIGFFLICIWVNQLCPPKPTPFRSFALNDPRKAIMLQRYYAQKEMMEREAQRNQFQVLMMKIESLKKKWSGP